ncbi:MAG: hypothetical protein KKA65_05330 [Nanoarchaeota archaeon]|nr:hypothetical protein [Nanoarchaeota archaeon]MBU4456894.1 hypothetical protein [Nanoarchaeota archaeon]
MGKIKNLFVTLAWITGLSTCAVTCYLASTHEDKPRQITREEMKSLEGSALEVEAIEGSKLVFNRPKFIYDFNHDDKADGICYRGQCSWVAPEFIDHGWPGYSRVMTPEIREAATKALNAGRELSFLLNQGKFNQNPMVEKKIK